MTQLREYQDYLEDIRQAAQKALAFVQGMTYEAFVADDKTVFAVVRALEIVGEATKRIPRGAANERGASRARPPSHCA
jgi:uncharacterized protein with HEPN domain